MYMYEVILVRNDTDKPFWYDYINLDSFQEYQNLKTQFINDEKFINEEIQNENLIYIRTLKFKDIESCKEFMSAFFTLFPNYRADFKMYMDETQHVGYTTIQRDFIPDLQK